MLAVFEATPSSKSDLQSLLGPQDIPALPDYMADEEPLPTSVHGIVTGPEEEVEEVQAEQHAPAKPAQPHQPTGTLYEMAAKICTVDDLLHFNDAWKMQNRLNVSSYQANPTPETQSTVEANLWFQLKTMERLMLQDMNLVQGMMRHKYSEQGYQDDLWEKIAVRGGCCTVLGRLEPPAHAVQCVPGTAMRLIHRVQPRGLEDPVAPAPTPASPLRDLLAPCNAEALRGQAALRRRAANQQGAQSPRGDHCRGPPGQARRVCRAGEADLPVRAGGRGPDWGRRRLPPDAPGCDGGAGCLRPRHGCSWRRLRGAYN
ncbi:hypothetical protein ACKKBG_A06205 [Auxenochlorella protothecoides x Auxenochlorella symbiontica]